MKNRYQKEKVERGFVNEMNYILNNYEKGKSLYPETFKIMERVVFRADELDNILVLEKAIEIFKTFRNKLNDLLPIEKEKELTLNIEMFNLLIHQEYEEEIAQDKLDELKPQFIEILSFLQNEREKIIGKRSFFWNNSMQELNKFYNSLISENLISQETTIEDFNRVFTYQPLSEINKIKWTGQSNLLAYLIDELGYSKQFKFTNAIFSIAKECFTNANNLSKLKFQYIDTNKAGKPKKHLIIDDILKTIEPLS
jgi:hypothetical protein|tara:strand:- start:1272 stop:2033 length:762 start_codon:yes stop_codon:yes gene_type:complete